MLNLCHMQAKNLCLFRALLCTIPGGFEHNITGPPCLLSFLKFHTRNSPVGFIFLFPLSNAVKLIWWLLKLILLLRIQSVPFLIKLQRSWSGVFKAKPGISGSVCVDPKVLKYLSFLLSQEPDLSTSTTLLHFSCKES